MRNEYRAFLEDRIAFLEKMIEIDKATLKTLDELLEMDPNEDIIEQRKTVVSLIKRQEKSITKAKGALSA